MFRLFFVVCCQCDDERVSLRDRERKAVIVWKISYIIWAELRKLFGNDHIVRPDGTALFGFTESFGVTSRLLKGIVDDFPTVLLQIDSVDRECVAMRDLFDHFRDTIVDLGQRSVVFYRVFETMGLGKQIDGIGSFLQGIAAIGLCIVEQCGQFRLDVA